MYLLVEECKSKREAIERSGLRVGQLVRIESIHAHGNTDGVWTVIPKIELIEESLPELKPSICQETEEN